MAQFDLLIGMKYLFELLEDDDCYLLRTDAVKSSMCARRNVPIQTCKK
jgi:hypothetical protein